MSLSPEEVLDQEVAARGGAAKVVAGIPAPDPAPLDLRRLAGMSAPPREWWMDGWLPKTGAGLLAGSGGSGKSTLMQQTATAQALQVDYIGRTTSAARVLVWNCEDDTDELWRRQEAISRYFEVPLDAPADRLHLVSRFGHENTLMAPMAIKSGRCLVPTPAFERLAEQINDQQIQQLWLDNVAHVYGGDPDDRNQVTGFINALCGMALGRPLSVVLVAHTARAQGSEFAGSAAWENACRVRWYFGAKLPDAKDDGEEQGDKSVRYLARRKSNYSALDHIRMTMRDGVLVPDSAPSRISGLMAQLDEKKADETVIAGFRSLRGMGMEPTSGKSSPDYLPRKIHEMRLSNGFGRHDLERALNRLLVAGVFEVGVVGVYANRTPKKGLKLKEGA